MRTIDKAKRVISRVLAKESISTIRAELSTTKDEWFRISAKAYFLYLQDACKKREEEVNIPNILCTSNEEINKILELNNKLSDFALCLPTTATMHDVKTLLKLIPDMPKSEGNILHLIEKMTLAPHIRALQNIGRIRHFTPFKEFEKIVEAATLCYYRRNYISSYLTLIPVIEGIILRWAGYQGHGEKPEFDEIRKFFNTSYIRQPCPGNPLFYEVFCKACHKIINEHLYKPSQYGLAYAEFNRHQASHMLRNTEFATKENCIRLFLLLDIMSEIYYYETYCEDPRFTLTAIEMEPALTLYRRIEIESLISNPETVLLR